MELSSDLVDAQTSFASAFSEVTDAIATAQAEHGKFSVSARKLVAEAALALKELRGVGLEPDEDTFAGSWVRWAMHVLKREYQGNSVLFLYYFEKNYGESPETTAQTDISYLVAMRALETCGTGFPRESTAWKWFVRDLPAFRQALAKFLAEKPAPERPNLLYLALNAIDTLASTKEGGRVGDELRELRTLAEQYQNDLAEHMGLRVYATDLARRGLFTFGGPSLPKSARWKSGAFVAFFHLRHGGEPEFPAETEERVPGSLWWIAEAWAKRLRGERYTGILPFYLGLDIDSIADVVWGKASELEGVTITSEEVDSVLALDAQGVKKIVHAYFTAHPRLTTTGRAKLAAELAKPDAGAELSDFNVEFQSRNGPLWVALPIKSGREAKGQKRERLEEKYLYQFVRPLLHFAPDAVAVFPILLVEPTLNTNEMLTLVRARLNLPILVIDANFFTKVAKKNGLLPR